ncbi:hypothetical protein [Parasphingorhabdus sp.]|uniref:hypothetical protein n=1 Tax=Parasphingorhabdus sp. TaxID=2709688 RepID=UPI0032EE5001
MPTGAEVTIPAGISGRELLVARPDMIMPETAQFWTLLVFGTAAFATFLYALWQMRRNHTVYPLWLLLGAIVASTYETLDNTLGHVYYPITGQISIYEILGIPLPLFTFFVYFFYIGATVIWVFSLLDSKSIDNRSWWTIYGFTVLGALIFEPPMLALGLWNYYGDNQSLVFLGFPIWWAIVNPASVIMVALVSYLIWDLLLERKYTILLSAIVPILLYGIHGGISAPIYMTINSTSSAVINNLAAVASILLALGVIWLGGKAIRIQNGYAAAKYVSTLKESS